MKTKLHLFFFATLFSLGMQAQEVSTVAPASVEADSTYDFTIDYTDAPEGAIVQIKFNIGWGAGETGITYGNKTVPAGDGSSVLSVPVPSDTGTYFLELQLMTSGWSGLDQEYYYGVEVVAPVVKVEEYKTGLEDLTILPNPFKDSFTYKYPVELEEPVTIELFTIDGRKIATIESAASFSNEGTVNTEDLSNGMYLVRFSSGDVQEIRRLIKN